MSRYKIIVEYDGTPFSGWQRQDECDTVQQRLEEAVFPLIKTRVTIYGSGRTDAGVHALGQVAHFDLSNYNNCSKIRGCMNAHLSNIPISVISVEEVDPNFDARFSAVERFYLYKILNRRVRPSIDVNRVWHIPYELDVNKMNEAAQCLIGKHDFSSFRATGCQSSSPTKTLNKISVQKRGDIIAIEVAARSFLYRQVRNIVGSLCFVGNKKWSKQNFAEVLNAKDRTKAGPTAPACGLYLLNVKY
ncbi:MAG: tRNA pseudouridine(38-40) synthase TruA [Holosporaceae bacterium]|jgi:tRNA pseudouridine38-40 synthase|nr:tRNA pseudouridine(38-40) synthase TruA [Holosporaceae bacterium]